MGRPFLSKADRFLFYKFGGYQVCYQNWSGGGVGGGGFSGRTILL